MAQESPLQTLDSLSSSSLSTSLSTNDQSQSSSDPSLLRATSFSRLNAQAPEFVPIRSPSSSSSTQTKQVQVPVSLQAQPPPPPPRVVMPPPPPPGAMMHHPHPHVYSPHQAAPFHLPIQNQVIPVHQQIHHLHHVPVQNYHHHRNHNHNHHQKQNHHHNSNSNQYHHHKNEDHQEFEIAFKNPKENKKDHHHHGGLSDESTQKILNQVEYYFSDLNLATTDHLMRFIHKDPEGYVPISVVASFKKIKALISSNSQLASVLRNSSKLVISEDGKKVKRQIPLTESELEELQSRIVVAENLPDDHCHQNLMKIFSAVGSVKTIRTCLPQTSGGGPSSASRTTKAADGMLFTNKLHAYVEYESVELAEKAIAELNNEGNWRRGLRVRLMLRHVSKNAQAGGKKGHEGEWHYEEETSTSEQNSNEKHLEDSSHQNDAHPSEHTGEEHVNDKDGEQRKGRNKSRGKGRGRGDRGQYHQSNYNRGHHVGTPPSNNMFSSEQHIIGKQPPGPRMPDGTRGFAMGRGKPVAVDIA